MSTSCQTNFVFLLINEQEYPFKSNTMKKILISIVAVCIFSFISFAQSADPTVIATAGGSYEDADMQVSWTLGETVIATISDGNTTLTQGFHQESYEVIGLDEVIKNENYMVNVFPNPTDNFINCDIKNENNIEKLIIRVLDAKGNQVNSKEFRDINDKTFNSKFDLSKAAPGEYILQIMNHEYNKSFKIIKK